MTQAELLDIYNQIAKWAIPAVLACAIRYLRQISVQIGDISKALAVAVTKIDQHEKRLDRHDALIGKALGCTTEG